MNTDVKNSRAFALLRTIAFAELPQLQRQAFDRKALGQAEAIVHAVQKHGDVAVRKFAKRFGEISRTKPQSKSKSAPKFVLNKEDLKSAFDGLADNHQDLLLRTASRIRAFAQAQKQCLLPLETTVPGGRAGHFVAPLATAGCYAPGGRYPLPSSVLMTAITARVAGVVQVLVASPKPHAITLAAAHVAEVDMFLAVGGAHAVAAMAYGSRSVPSCDIIVGPGNAYVTAAKYVVSRHVKIDMLAGPSELVVLAHGPVNAQVIAADLLAQAEHDPLALPVLITTNTETLRAVNAELFKQLAALPTAAIARESLRRGFAVVAKDLDDAIAACNTLAPEHLQVHAPNPKEIAPRLHNFGALFLGENSAEVFGDYGIGPNHVLPTGGTARFSGGLSVLTFMAVRTWLDISQNKDAAMAIQDAAALARLEGLEAHARAAELRRK